MGQQKRARGGVMVCFYSAMDKRLPFIFNHYSVWIAETGGSVARMTLIHNGCAHAPFFYNG